jgi:ABC-type uncharacterized transport system permease subunit
MVELLFLPALLGYGEAAVAFAGDARHPGRAGVAAVWGVRVGWLAQTALIVAQATASGGFPWDTWAGSLNLFVWLVVSAYLVWGCRERYRLLGVAVMPFAALLLVAAWLAGAADVSASPRYSTGFLAFHVGLVLVAFAGFTVAAALSGLYLFEERRLKHRRPAVLFGRAPSLVSLDTVAARTVLVSLAALTAGVGLGLARLDGSAARVDALMGATALTAGIYAAYLVLRREAGWRGHRAALLALGGFAVVVVARLALSLTHFT